MQNSYLKTFNHLFFNIDNYKDVKEAIEQASYVLDSVITRFGEIENKMTIGTSRKDNFVDLVIILFIRKIMEQLDSINVLYSTSLLEPAQVILRSLIENIAGLEFILKENTEKRAAAYYLEHHYQELDKSQTWFNEESKYGQLIIEQKGRAEFDEDCKKIEKKKQALGRLVNSNPIFREIDADRKNKLETKKKKHKRQYIQWYEVCSDVTSIYGLLEAIGYENYYDGIYGGLSFESHGLNAAMGMSADENGFSLKWIRNPESGGATFEIACSFSIGVLQKIYNYLGDGECEKAEFKNYFVDFVKQRKIAGHNLDMIRSTSASKPKSEEDS